MQGVVLTLEVLLDDAFQLVIAACSDTEDDVPLFEAVKGLGCVSKALLRQLHRLRPLVSVRSLAIVQRPAHGPWRVMLSYKGELMAAVVEQAQLGRVRSINSVCTSLAPAAARRVVPELLGAGCSLLKLSLSYVKLNGTWAATFGEAAVFSAVLRELHLQDCGLLGPFPELRLPALQELNLMGNQLCGGLELLQGCRALRRLNLSSNRLTGGLEQLPSCTALRALYLANNFVTGNLESLRDCTALLGLHLCNNQLTGGLEPLQNCKSMQCLSLNSNQFTGGLDALRGCTALEELILHNNQLTGGLEPLRGCTALQQLWLSNNHLTGGLNPLLGCTELHTLDFEDNPKLVPSDEDRAHFEKQCVVEECEEEEGDSGGGEGGDGNEEDV